MKKTHNQKDGTTTRIMKVNLKGPLTDQKS